MSEKSRQYTAFTVGSLGVYEFLRMPYGLCNAPATFQRLMQNCLGELNLTYALVYLDNVIMYSKTEEDHPRWLQAVFEQFHGHRLKLKPSKCSFLRKKITFLSGYHADTPITIKAEPFIWPTAAFINIHEHPL